MIKLIRKQNYSVYNLKLHECCYLNEIVKFLRVPGGWIYYDLWYDEINVLQKISTFVPYNEDCTRGI